MLVVEGGLLMAGNSLAAGGRWGRQLIDRVPLLRPDEQLVTAVLSGWRNQQLVWNRAHSMIEGRERAARALTRQGGACGVGMVTAGG